MINRFLNWEHSTKVMVAALLGIIAVGVYGGLTLKPLLCVIDAIVLIGLCYLAYRKWELNDELARAPKEMVNAKRNQYGKVLYDR